MARQQFPDAESADRRRMAAANFHDGNGLAQTFRKPADAGKKPSGQFWIPVLVIYFIINELFEQIQLFLCWASSIL